MADNKKEEVADEIDGFDLNVIMGDALKCLKKFWYVLLAVTVLLCVFFCVRYYRSYVPEYISKATMTISSNYSESLGELSSSTYYFNRATANQLTAVFPYLIGTNLTRNAIKKDLGVSGINGTISAYIITNTNLITVSVSSSSAQDAKSILESVIRIYPDIAELVTGNVKIAMLTEPNLPEEPSNTVPYSTGVKKGLFIGTAFSVLFISLYVVTRSTVRQSTDIESRLFQSCLAVIPRADFKRRTQHTDKTVSVLNRKVSSSFLEAFRSLRMKVIKNSEETGNKVYLITSSVHDEGKTAVSFNLAVSLSKLGKKVLFINTDASAENKADGLYEYLNGDIAFSDIMRYNPNTSIYSIDAGKKTIGQTSTAVIQRLGQLFTELKKTMDFIIIDTPPCSLLADASVIAGQCDSIIFVVRQDFVKIGTALDAIQNITGNKAQILGAVLNMADRGVSGYGYGKGYGYGYSYRYGSYYTYGYGKKAYGESDGKAVE